MNFSFIPTVAKSATWYTLVTLTATAILFLSFEPTVSHSGFASPNTFTVSQQILGEISFLVTTPNVTMNGAINGLTGGTATGSTQAVVQTNSATGYTMDITFGSSTPAMLGNVTGGTGIRDYAASTTGATFAFVASTSAVFAYTVSASNTLDVAQAFRDDGTLCGVSTGDTANACWRGPTTTAVRIVSRTSAATNGATTTIQFRVNVPNNPSPSVNADTYTATATLTAVNQ